MNMVQWVVDHLEQYLLPGLQAMPFFEDLRISRHGNSKSGFMLVTIVMSQDDDAIEKAISEMVINTVLACCPIFPLAAMQLSFVVFDRTDVAA